MKLTPFLIGTVVLGAIYQASPVRPVVVTGISMSPTFESYNVVMGNRRFTSLRRGDVVVFDYDGSRAIKRVAHLPGDRIPQFLIQGEWMTPQNRAMHRTFERFGAPRREVIVPAGHVWVIGDNPEHSRDSRHYGAIPISCVDMKVETSAEITPMPVPTAHFARGTEVDRAS